jgi:hypothetical protein
MALDLARIAHFAGRDGKLHETIQRPNLAFVDGIIGGEGEGPLAPKAVASGCLVFSDDVALEDELACRLMGFPPELLPIVREAVAALRPGSPHPATKKRGENAPIRGFALSTPEPGKDAFHRVPNSAQDQGRGGTRPYHFEGEVQGEGHSNQKADGQKIVFYNGHQVEMSNVEPALGRAFLPPRGWKRVGDDVRGHSQQPAARPPTSDLRPHGPVVP